MENVCEESCEECFGEVVKMKFLLKEFSKNLSELHNINIITNNNELQKLKKDLDYLLNDYSVFKQNNTSKYLLKQTEDYLKKHCKHHYIEDIYDVGEDGFKKICYCNKCYDGY